MLVTTVAAFLGALLVFLAIYLVLVRRTGRRMDSVAAKWLALVVLCAAIAVAVGVLSAG
jgi:ABC-type Fe3+-siderophore transport system permease subunit